MKNTPFVVSEAVPFIKTGGLADVVGPLPTCFDRRYYDMCIMLSKYLCIPERYRNQIEYVMHLYMNFDDADRYVGILRLIEDSITFYSTDNESYFGRLRSYGDWLYDLEKLALFSCIVFPALLLLNFRLDLVHCHDWQTGLTPVYLRERFAGGESFRGAEPVMTVHNLKFQGIWDAETIERITGPSEYFFIPDKLEPYKSGNLLKDDIIYADTVATVSLAYAEEIQTSFHGEDLDGLAQVWRNSLRGIVNDTGYHEFNSATDSKIVERYDMRNFHHEKKKNKAALQERLGLPVGDKKFVLGIMSRLTDRKGFDLIQGVIEELCQEGLQSVILGTGEERYENLLRYYDWKYHDKLSVQTYYSDDVAHTIYVRAGAYLMSLFFEPCGLSQMIAFRYGTLPIVRETGGLEDMTKPYNGFANTGVGSRFTSCNAYEMLDYIRYIKWIYNERRRD